MFRSIFENLLHALRVRRKIQNLASEGAFCVLLQSLMVAALDLVHDLFQELHPRAHDDGVAIGAAIGVNHRGDTRSVRCDLHRERRHA